ncbi:MAG: hydroxypyruvate isomerase family protein [Gammaproteobacteria bacterium]|nr:hydroxypyruvate isomerase family protein [Gammaproteobacteria bacterium]
MPKLAANLSMMFTERGFLDRFEAAAACGFRGVEYLFPYDFDAADIARALREHKLENALFNFPPGDWDNGERGLAGVPGREADFRASVDLALDYAGVLGCKTLHVMYGFAPQGADPNDCEALFIDNLRMAAKRAQAQSITLLMEPLNSRDMPGYPLLSQRQAHDLVAKIGVSNVQVQFDFYHCQIMEGDVAMKIREFLGGFGHVQIAGVPERHEPNIGEVNYTYLLDVLDQVGYDAWVGCEYRPIAGTEAGLGWAEPYGIRAPS